MLSNESCWALEADTRPSSLFCTTLLFTFVSIGAQTLSLLCRQVEKEVSRGVEMKSGDGIR